MTEHIWRTLQLILAGGFVVIAATMGDLGDKSGPAEPSPIVNDLQRVAQAVRDSKAPSRPVMVGPDRTMELIQSASSINDLKNLALPETAQKLIESMINDEFDVGNPFTSIDKIYAMGLILQRGVKSFHRDVYRSSQFTRDLGYDVLRYEVMNSDGQSSFIMAYKEKTAVGQTGIGQRDERPVFAMILVPQDEGQFHLSLFSSGQPALSQTVTKEEAMDRLLSRIDQSTPLLSSRTNF